MEGRRYSEGGEIPVLSYPDRSPGYTATEAMQRKRREKMLIPKGVEYSRYDGARLCFVSRHNSRRLQEFLLNYAYTVVTSKALSGEV